jgi:hypothetical protein
MQIEPQLLQNHPDFTHHNVNECLLSSLSVPDCRHVSATHCHAGPLVHEPLLLSSDQCAVHVIISSSPIPGTSGGEQFCAVISLTLAVFTTQKTFSKIC